MVVDTDDHSLHAASKPLGTFALPTDYCPQPRFNQKVFFFHLPNEIILRTIEQLLLQASDSQDSDDASKSVGALSVTSRRLHNLTCDQTTLRSHVNQRWPFHARLYPEVTWNVRTVKRFYKYRRQDLEFRMVVRKKLRQHEVEMRKLPKDEWDNFTIITVLAIQMMDGLEDNSPEYGRLNTFCFPWLVAIHFTSIFFGRLFVQIHQDDLDICNILRTRWRTAAYGALHLMFLRGGPVVAIRLLRWGSLPKSEFMQIKRFYWSTMAFVSNSSRGGNLDDVRPDLFIREQLGINTDAWLWESESGKKLEAWHESGMGPEERTMVLKCLYLWRSSPPTW
jgi:hypothetical protein